MLLTKKMKFSMTDSQIKEDILSKDGDLLLKINIKYPDIKCAKNDPLAKYAKGFYADIATSFHAFAKNELSKLAYNAYNTDKSIFLPYAAVMRYEVTLENSDYLSVLLDISVSDGIKSPSIERKTQVWERKNGTKCRYTDFFPKKYVDELFSNQTNKHNDYNLFVLTECGIEFFVQNGNNYNSITANIK